MCGFFFWGFSIDSDNNSMCVFCVCNELMESTSGILTNSIWAGIEFCFVFFLFSLYFDSNNNNNNNMYDV